MSDPIIRVENLGKKYIIGHQQEGRKRYVALRDVLANGASRLLKSWGKRELNPAREEFWALKDVSFEVKQGEVIGIIGRNGAGKSTLLKVLSRITEPTTGRIAIKGRVASLLEVGTGFHPELTGRENIYLNGAILGMSKAEIKKKFDEIVAFAEVEKFLDTPVKRYSSGMYVRLAFAVAAHLEPEILVVDEVLAVGDAAFQKKCLGKIGDVATKEGRTVLFVSHQMEAVESLCNKVILLKGGKIIQEGSTLKVISYYLGDIISQTQTLDLRNRRDRKGSGEYYYSKIWLTNSQGDKVSFANPGEPINIHLQISKQANQASLINPLISIGVHDNKGYRLFTLSNTLLNQSFNINGETELCCTIEKVKLYEGDYRCNLFMANSNNSIIDWLTDAFILSVSAKDYFGTGKVVKDQGDKFFVNHSFQINRYIPATIE